MAQLAIFTVFLLALSGALPALSGLIPVIPDIPGLPSIADPTSVDDACNEVDRGVAIGKSSINTRISTSIDANLKDPSLTPVCKECIEKKSNEIRKKTLTDIDATGELIKGNLRKATDLISLLTIWNAEIIKALPSRILGIVQGCEKDLEIARSDCIASTAEPSGPSPVIPNTPIADPTSVEDACKKVDRGAAMGKSSINARISLSIAANLNDPSLTPVCKECIAKKSNEIRKNTLADIDAAGEQIKGELRQATDLISLLTIWNTEIVKALPSRVLGIVQGCDKDLEIARSDCIASTAEA